MTCFVTKYVTFSKLVAPRSVMWKELGYMLRDEIAEQTVDPARQKFGSGV